MTESGMRGFPGLPSAGAEPRQIAAIVNRMNLGKINCTGEVTLAPGQATTTVDDARCGARSIILLMPLTPSAAAEQAGGALHVETRDNGRFVIRHANGPEADRRFGYAIIG